MDIDTIEELALLLRENPISEICVSEQAGSLHLRKGSWASRPQPDHLPEHAQTHPVHVLTADSPTVDATEVVMSQWVGLFHHVKPAVAVHSHVTAGQVVGNVETMRLMNGVTANVAGRVVEVMLEDGEPVEYGRPLFRIRPE